MTVSRHFAVQHGQHFSRVQLVIGGVPVRDLTFDRQTGAQVGPSLASALTIGEARAAAGLQDGGPARLA